MYQTESQTEIEYIDPGKLQREFEWINTEKLTCEIEDQSNT